MQTAKQFSITALAETNIYETNKSSLDNWARSGHGIYIADKFQFTRIENSAFVLETLKSLFIEVNYFNDQGLMYITVVCYIY